MELQALEVLALAAAGVFAGGLGSLVGIGGGVVLVPALVLLFGVDIRVAVATSLVSVVATSSAAGSVYVGKGLANMRLGMTLEIATTLGGICGGLISAVVPGSLLAGLFAAMMAVTSMLTLRSKDAAAGKPSGEAAEREQLGHEVVGALAGSYFDTQQQRSIDYRGERLGLGSVVSFAAGIVSGLLGVGGGFIKVPAMSLGMRVPIKVAAATSNFMIGVTAVSSLFVYLARGLVHPYLAAPVALGVVAGAFAGTALARKVSPRALRRLLAAVLLLVSAQMLLRALGVSLGH